ncbi:uncharacterized protein LOC127282475 isoform X2 [Leptopilina boulardi]|uniref:uncharacterized protein LOC127282475 isoform X2 n=1 Tax=Leptopilina boulardi TaxID=63433 RepID=UPI0021F6458C|nr:uncharacterized protein LOC127282475 isoform X2 [Leptopilina boulardi]
MPLVEQSSYGSQQINVPPSLPMILKQFCKAAIRTQPYDLLKWSSAYFRALAEGEEPPSKIRLEYPPPTTASGLTLGFLKVLLRQLGDYNKVVPVETLLRRWDCLCLDRLLTSSLFETMIMICELFTHEPDGGSAMIPVSLFMELYGFLAGLRCDGTARDPGDDPHCTFFDESDQGDNSENHDCLEKSKMKNFSSPTSQDTETDVNLDLESCKDDDESLIKNEKNKTSENREEKLTSEESDEQLLSNGKSPNNETSDNSSKLADNNNFIQSDNEDSVEVKKILDKNSEQSSVELKIKNNRRISISDGERVKMKISDSSLYKFYPNIPGIGPRLSAEEVACIAIWMSECARRQEGMVGPRNLRHSQCPPLDKQRIHR